jgi:hypothetical protein
MQTVADGPNGYDKHKRWIPAPGALCRRGPDGRVDAILRLGAAPFGKSTAMAPEPADGGDNDAPLGLSHVYLVVVRVVHVSQ